MQLFANIFPKHTPDCEPGGANVCSVCTSFIMWSLVSSFYSFSKRYFPFQYIYIWLAGKGSALIADRRLESSPTQCFVLNRSKVKSFHKTITYMCIYSVALVLYSLFYIAVGIPAFPLRPCDVYKCAFSSLSDFARIVV